MSWSPSPNLNKSWGSPVESQTLRAPLTSANIYPSDCSAGRTATSHTCPSSLPGATFCYSRLGSWINSDAQILPPFCRRGIAVILSADGTLCYQLLEAQVQRVFDSSFSSCIVPAYYWGLSILCKLGVEVWGLVNSAVCQSSVLGVKSEVLSPR